MRRLIAITLLLIAVPLVLVFGIAANDGGGSGYKVRAIFDFVRAVPGEDVKVAGAKVGKIESLHVTPDNKAAVVLNIKDSGFTPFHTNAHCTIRPQSLIGETFAECSPGSSAAPVLPTIQQGDGKGQHLLPVSHTSSPVDIDEINDIMREPTRERLGLIINEFGTALAGRGKDLNTAIHRANPALRDTDKVLAILAAQNRTLADLAKNSDAVLTPLAARRRQVADFIVQANRTAQATAQVRGAISAGIARFPAFLRQLKPTLTDLGALSDEMTPVITDLGRAAPGLNRFIVQLGPFSKAATPAVKSLGDATDVGRPALVQSKPLVTLLAKFATDAQPTGRLLDELLTSLDKTGGIEELMNFIFFQATGTNGFDGVSHYLRAGLITNLCSSYATTPIGGCNANFRQTKAIQGSAAGAAQDKSLAKLETALRTAKTTGGQGAKVLPGAGPLEALHQLTDPHIASLRNQGLSNIRQGPKAAGGNRIKQ